MAGFRDATRTAAILRGFHLPWLDEIAHRIETTDTPFQTLRAVVTDLLGIDRRLLHERLQDLRAAAVDAEARAHAAHAGRRQRGGSVDPTALERESVRVYAATTPLVECYPDDPGVLVTLLLNHVVLAAGEAMFIDAGVIHAYTSGFGVEIMAASDNVLRAGLTRKHVDIPELLEVTNFTPTPPPQWAPSHPAAGVTVFSPPVDEFELVVVEVTGSSQLPTRPQIVLCLEGQVHVRSHDGEVLLTSGQAAFVRGTETSVHLDGRARVVVGRTP